MSMRHKLRASLEAYLTKEEVMARVEDGGVESELDTFDPNALPEAENEITQDLDELDAIATKSEALEQLQVTLESIGSLDAGATQLANIAYGQIMSGTDMERVSLEASDFLGNVKDSVTAFVRRAKEILAELWRKIQDFIYRVFSFIPRRIKALEELKQQIKDKDESEFAGQIPLSSKIFDGLMPGEGNFNFNDIGKAIANLQKESQWYFTEYSAGLKVTQRNILDSKDIEELSKAALPFYDTMRKRYRNVAEDGMLVGRGEYLPGGYRIVVKSMDIVSSDPFDIPLNRDEAVALAGYTAYRTRVRVVHDAEPTSRPPSLPVLPKREVLSLLEDALQQLRILEKHRSQYKAHFDNVQSAWDGWTTRFLAGSAEKESNKYNSKNSFGRLMMASSSFADWTKEPINGLTSISLRFSAAIAAYVGKCAKVEVPAESTELVAVAN